VGFSVPAGWNLAAVADYDGNGTPDLFLQHRQTSQVAVWALNRLQVLEQGSLPASYVQGILTGGGDLTGDGAQDLLWQRPDGTLVASLLNDHGQVQSLATVGKPPPGFVVAELRAFSAGPGEDILLQDTNRGTVSLWRLNEQTQTVDRN